MFCLFSNIFVCGIQDLNYLNLANFNYIINCENKFNTCITSPNYINLNIDNFNQSNFNLMSDVYTWVENNFNNNKIILLDETGLGNAMILAIYLIMRSKNEQFNTVYTNIGKYISLPVQTYYNILLINENQIIKNNFFFQPVLISQHIPFPQSNDVKNNSNLVMMELE